MFPPEFPQETSGPAFAALRRGRQCCSGDGACPELVERMSRLPQSPAPAERGRGSAASRAVALRVGRPVTPERSVGGFTLLELLVVMGIILIALAALVPAVTSLSKSGGRRAALNSLLGGIEQARAEAIKSSQATYVVFPVFTGGTQSTLDRYNYRSYAIFEDDAAIPGNVKQLTDWKSFPTGVALRAAGTAALSNLADPAALTPSVAFSFPPDASAAPFKCFKFNSNGEVQAPAGNVLLCIFEGYVNSGSEVATTKDGSGNPSAVEYLMVSQFTGRAEPTASP
jgi:prepilin-type N-terminal cleavage/methylation domain-containing protein